jgi:succinoglycan biosynthesis transport protein ExoP
MSSGSLIPAPGNNPSVPEVQQPGWTSSHAPHLGSDVTTVGDYWRILIKRKWTVVTTLILMVVLVTIFSLRMTKLYRAAGRIALTTEAAGVFKDTPGSNGNEESEISSIETQVKIIQSESLALQVAHKLQLERRPEFGGQKTAAGMNVTDTRNLNTANEGAYIGFLRGSLEVETIPNTRMIEIRYINPDPKFSAAVVNAYINAYVEQNIKTKFDSTMQAADWLSKQLADLQIKVESSQQKLVEYERAHEIVGTDEKKNVVMSKLDQVNSELTIAENDRIQKQALYTYAKSGNAEMLAAVVQNPLAQKLREQEADLTSQHAQLSAQFGPQYPKVIEINTRIQQVQRLLDAEVQKSIGRLQTDYLASQKREDMLRSAFDKQKQEANTLSQDSIQYSILKRDADSNRNIYEGLLQKLKEAGIEAGLRSSNIRIVDYARAPAGPYKPDVPRNMWLAILIGLTGGIALAFAVEAMDNTVRTVEQAESISQVPSLGMIPLATAASEQTAYGRKFLNKGGNKASTAALSLNDPVAHARPKSQIAETYRAVRTSILLSSMGRPPKTILVTSALPQEGKSVTSVNTAIVLAQQGSRVLIIDADLRRPTIHKHLRVPVVGGLSRVLTGTADIDKAIVPWPKLPQLHVLPAGPHPPHPAELLSSQAMRDLLEQLKERYDHILIDTPPVLSVTDAVLLSVQVDSVLLVLRSGRTTKMALRRACDLLFQVSARLTGVIVNGVDLRSPDYYYYYYSGSKYYGGYYHEENPQKATEASAQAK